MSELVEFAPAKINLTLDVLGRRGDGYHEIESLVAFARNVGDIVRLHPGAVAAITTSGPTANAIAGDNLADRALRLVLDASPPLQARAVHLEKHLPVAGGVGGGSADAAAVLRLLQRAEPDRARSVDWNGIATSLGADVLVCLGNAPALMSGIGERIAPMNWPGPLFAVLVNPNALVPADKTARVFKELSAQPVQGAAAKPVLPVFASPADVIDYASKRSNALQAAATGIMPEIKTVLAALTTTGDCLTARLSGAGPTCFGLYETKETALHAARKLQTGHLSWWVRYAELS